MTGLAAGAMGRLLARGESAVKSCRAAVAAAGHLILSVLSSGAGPCEQPHENLDSRSLRESRVIDLEAVAGQDRGFRAPNGLRKTHRVRRRRSLERCRLLR